MKIEFLHKLTTNSQSKVKGLAKFWLLLIFLLGSAVPALADDWYDAGDYIYVKNFKPSGWTDNWVAQDAWIHLWKDGGSTVDVKLVKIAGTSDMYKAKVGKSDNYTKIIFTRNPSGSTGPWDRTWNQTGNMNITNGKSGFTDFSAGNTSYTVFNYRFHLVGSFTDANWQGTTDYSAYTKYSYQTGDFSTPITWTVNSSKMNLNANGKFEFKVKIDNTWYGCNTAPSDGATLNLSTSGGNMEFVPISGDYKFSLTRVSGTLKLKVDFPQKKTPTLSDYNVFTPTSVPYDGTTKSVTITPKTSGAPTVKSIKYLQNGQSVTPKEVGKYKIQFTTNSSPTYKEATLTFETPLFEITCTKPAKPTIAQIAGNCKGDQVILKATTTAKNYQWYTLTPAGEKSVGDPNQNLTLTNVPAGNSYWVKAYNESSSEACSTKSDNLAIKYNPAATADGYTLATTSATYTGKQQAPVTINKNASYPDVEATFYKGSATVPTNSGVYPITINTGANDTYCKGTGLALGDFTISGYELYLGTTKLGITTNGGATLPPTTQDLSVGAYNFSIVDKATGDEVKYGNKTINRTSVWTELAQSATAATLIVDEAGSYTFEVKVAGGKVQVKVTYPEKTPATPGSVSGADKLCPGTSSSGYTATGDAYTKSFRWAIEGTGWDVSPKTTGLDGTVKVTAGTAESATLKVWAVNENKESAAPLTKTISLKHAPATPTITGEGSASPGQKGLKYSVENVPGETYTWSVSAGWDITSSNIGNEITVTAGTTQGTITVEASNTNGCGTATASKQVSVSAIEAPEFTQVVSESCPNTTHTFTISPISTAGASYVWTVPTGNGWAVNPNGLSAQVTVGTTAGTVSVHAVVNGVAGKNAEQSVSIKPSVGAVTITGTTTVKKGSVVTYTASADNATSYSWELPSEWTAPAKTGASIKVTFGQNSTQNTIKCIAKDACDRTSEKSITITYQKANAVKTNYWVDPATASYTGSTVNTTVKKYIEVPTITEIKYYKGGQLDSEHKTAGKYQLKVSGAETLEYNAVTDLDLGEAFTIEGYHFVLAGKLNNGAFVREESQAAIYSDPEITFTKTFAEAGTYSFSVIDNATGGDVYYQGGKEFSREINTGWTDFPAWGGDAKLTVDEFGPENVYTFHLKIEAGQTKLRIDIPAKTPEAPKWDAHPEKMCPNADAVFSVTPVEGATYNWTASNSWTITPNSTNPYQATLHSGATGTSKVSVTVTKSGKTSKAIEQSVALISSLAQPGAISGKTKVVAEENGVTYSVAAVPDAEEYIWTLPQGWLIASGEGTRSISVSVGASSGVKTIKVQAKNACFTSAARELQVTVDTKPVTGMMYFDNTYTKFAQPWLYIGHGLNGGYTKNYKMQRVKGTQYLWYSTQGWWSDAQRWYIAYTNVWSDGQGTNEPYYNLACHFSNKEATIDWNGDFYNNYVYKAQSGTSDYNSYCSDGSKHTIQVYKWFDDSSKKISYSTYTVTVNKTGNGTVTLKDYDQRGVASGAKVSYLTTLKMTATADPGYTLIGVKDGAGYPWENPSTNAYTIKNNTTFNVKFVKNPDAPQVDGKQTTKGAPVLLKVKNHVAGQQYEWYNKDTGVKISGSSDQITVSPEKTTNYKVRAKISEDGKTIYSEFGFVTVEVLQELPLTVSVVGGSNPTCPNQTVTLSATTGNVNETFVEWWSTEDDGKTPYRMLQTTAKNNPDYSTNFTTTIYETTTYYVVAYADPVGKTVIGKTLFTVTAKTAKIVIDPQTTAKSPYKAGNTIYLKLDPEEYVTSATWRLPNGQTFTGKRCSFTIPQGVLGVYNVSATIQDDCTSSRQLSIALPVSGGAIQATTTSFTIKENDASKVLNIGFTPEPTEIVCTKVVSQPAGSEYASVEDIVIKGTQLSWNVPKSPANGAYKYQIRASRDQYDDYIGTITINYTDDGASCKIVLVDGAIDGNKIFPYEPVNMKIANNNPQGVVWSVEAPASEKPAISNVTISGGTSKLQFRVPKLGKVSNSLYIVYATCTSQDGKKSSVQEYKFYLQETEDEHCN